MWVILFNSGIVYGGETTNVGGKTLVRIIEKALDQENADKAVKDLKNNYFKDNDGLDSLKLTAQTAMAGNEDKLNKYGIDEKDVYKTIDNLKNWDKESRMKLIDYVSSGNAQKAAQLIDNDGQDPNRPVPTSGGGGAAPAVKDDETKHIDPVEEIKTKFEDIKDHWAEDSIIYMTDTGIVSGISETNFNPNGKINRAEIATLMVKILKIDEKKVVYMPFEDVSLDDWYYKFVRAAFNSKVVSGTSKNTFNPLSNITREQIITMAINTLSNKEIDIKGDITQLDKYSDRDKISSWALDYMAKGEEFGIVLSEEKINPQEFVTRAEAVWILEKVYKIINK